MKMSKQFLILFSIFFSFTTSANTSELVKKFEELKNKSLNFSPELKTSRALENQKIAESYSKLTTHLPNANLVLRKEKDFFESRNAQLRALGVVPQDFSWGINYEWSLINFTQIQNTRKSFTEQDKSEIDAYIKESEYPIVFTTHFLNYLLAKYKSAAVENSLKKAETGKQEAQLGFDLGQKTRIDVLRSEANSVSLDSKKTTFIEEEQNTKNRFVEYAGIEANDITFVNGLSEDAILDLINSLSQAEPEMTLPNLPASPEYRSLVLQEKINKLELAQLTRTEYPELKIQGSYLNTADSYSQSIHAPYRTHTVALVLTIPLFSGGSFTSSHFEKYFAKKQIEYTVSRQKLQLENDLNTKLTKIRALQTLVSSLSLNVSQFEELYRLTSKSYQLGKSSLFELLEVQDDLLESKINLAQNKIQFYSLSQNYRWQAGL